MTTPPDDTRPVNTEYVVGLNGTIELLATLLGDAELPLPVTFLTDFREVMIDPQVSGGQALDHQQHLIAVIDLAGMLMFRMIKLQQATGARFVEQYVPRDVN